MLISCPVNSYKPKLLNSVQELVALGERIGTVNTGLSDDSISKCLREMIHCASDYHIQDDERCVICLVLSSLIMVMVMITVLLFVCFMMVFFEYVKQEEYKDMDDVGILKTCGHDFHVECVKQWLSLKNVCPICKAAALGDEA